jgi:hypothetical protein
VAVTSRLSKKLVERLGDEAGSEFVEWIEDVNRQLSQVRGDIAALRTDMVSFEGRMSTRFESLKFEMLKWLFLFWVGTIGLVLAIVKL